MNKHTVTQVALLTVAALAVVGVAVYCNRDTLLVSEEQRNREGGLLTTIILRLQEASHRAKKLLTPMTRKDIENIVWLETSKYNAKHGKSIKVRMEFSDNSNNAAVKQITLFSPIAKAKAKLYCR